MIEAFECTYEFFFRSYTSIRVACFLFCFHMTIHVFRVTLMARTDALNDHDDDDDLDIYLA